MDDAAAAAAGISSTPGSGTETQHDFKQSALG